MSSGTAPSQYESGRAREYKVRNHMIAHGWLCTMRASGSKGPADLLMVHPRFGFALVQVGGPSKVLGPAQRERLVDHAQMGGALPLLATPRVGVGWRFWIVTRASAAHWQRWDP